MTKDPKEQLFSIGKPPQELQIDTSLVRNLLRDRHPDLANLSIEPVDAGWDNMMFRLGEDLAVRLPRRQLGAKLITNERIWLPIISQRLPIAVPTPYRLGEPTLYYPWQWTVVPWFAGVTADLESPRADMAEFFASCLRSLHIPAPDSAPENPFRGVPLATRAANVEERMKRLEAKTNSIDRKLKQIWNSALKASIDVDPAWLHGDLHPRNILVKNGKIIAIIDWGDMTAGDIATDLASFWMLFDDRSFREKAIDRYGNLSEATIQRARGWAILFGVILLDAGLVDDRQQAKIGERILRNVVAEY